MATSEPRKNIRVLLVSHGGAGFADRLKVPQGTTVGQLFADHVGGEPTQYNITVNGAIVDQRDALSDGDRVLVAPPKIVGNHG